MTFHDRRCCTLEGNFYAVSDGACGSAALCGDAEGATDNVCDGYKLGRRGRCVYRTCTGDGCNVVGGFNLGADDSASRRSAWASAFVVAAAAWLLWREGVFVVSPTFAF